MAAPNSAGVDAMRLNVLAFLSFQRLLSRRRPPSHDVLLLYCYVAAAPRILSPHCAVHVHLARAHSRGSNCQLMSLGKQWCDKDGEALRLDCNTQILELINFK
jgi:hypothetical protein